MRRRVVGIETEYGLTCATRSGAPPIHDADAAARLLFAPLALSGRAPNVYLRNGGRLYLDVGAHPEYATAECDSFEDLLAQHRCPRAKHEPSQDDEAQQTNEIGISNWPASDRKHLVCLD